MLGPLAPPVRDGDRGARHAQCTRAAGSSSATATTEVPFVDDGAGAVVARWPLAQTVTLRVVARFGDVVIPSPRRWHIESIPDARRSSTLEGAPRRIRLVDARPRTCRSSTRRSDDHGLREVHLVLRSGTREERRVLARLDGETRTTRRATCCKLRDPFLTQEPRARRGHRRGRRTTTR